MEDNKTPQGEENEAQLPVEGDGHEMQPEKKLSRTTLTFYIIGLFLVAIALILVSYISQVRSNKQLQNLNTQLSDQQKVAQGATQKMEDLQKQLTAQSEELAAVRKALGIEGTEIDTAKAVQAQQQALDAVYQLLRAEDALRAGDRTAAKAQIDKLTGTYGADRLGATDDKALLSAEGAAIYKKLTQELAE